jgi:hypothetical protein
VVQELQLLVLAQVVVQVSMEWLWLAAVAAAVVQVVLHQAVILRLQQFLILALLLLATRE